MHQITKKNYFKNDEIYICKATFEISESKKSYPNAFANITDKNEIIVIIKQSKYNNNIIEVEKDWRILIFDMFLLSELFEGEIESGFTNSHENF